LKQTQTVVPLTLPLTCNRAFYWPHFLRRAIRGGGSAKDAKKKQHAWCCRRQYAYAVERTAAGIAVLVSHTVPSARAVALSPLRFFNNAAAIAMAPSRHCYKRVWNNAYGNRA